MRKNFESEIQQLKDELLLLGSMVEQQIFGAVESLKKRDLSASRHIQEMDEQVNAKRYAIEQQVMIVIATLFAYAKIKDPNLRIIPVVLGIGFATLKANNGVVAMRIADVDGVNDFIAEAI